jgi:hypothetical protein
MGNAHLHKRCFAEDECADPRPEKQPALLE